MHISSRARIAGSIGMIGGVFWMISVIMQYSLGLFTSDGSSLDIAHTLLALSAIIGAMSGFIGLLWGQAFRARLGATGVIIYIIGWAFIIIGGIGLLVLGDAESPLFLVFPIGGNLQTLGCFLFGIATVIGAGWSGWQRWMPLVTALVLLLTTSLPMLLGLTSDGPGMIPELLMGVVWFGIGLAVFTAYRQSRSAPTPAVRTT